MNRIIPLVIGAVVAVAVALWSAPSHAQSLPSLPSLTTIPLYGGGQTYEGTTQGGQLYNGTSIPMGSTGTQLLMLDNGRGASVSCTVLPMGSGMTTTIC